jgi:hypothetical protein
MFGVLFCLLFLLLVSGRYCLDISLFEKLQDYKEEDLEQQQAGSKTSDSWPY